MTQATGPPPATKTLKKPAASFFGNVIVLRLGAQGAVSTTDKLWLFAFWAAFFPESLLSTEKTAVKQSEYHFNARLGELMTDAERTEFLGFLDGFTNEAKVPTVSPPTFARALAEFTKRVAESEATILAIEKNTKTITRRDLRDEFIVRLRENIDNLTLAVDAVSGHALAVLGKKTSASTCVAFDKLATRATGPFLSRLVTRDLGGGRTIALLFSDDLVSSAQDFVKNSSSDTTTALDGHDVDMGERLTRMTEVRRTQWKEKSTTRLQREEENKLCVSPDMEKGDVVLALARGIVALSSLLKTRHTKLAEEAEKSELRAKQQQRLAALTASIKRKQESQLADPSSVTVSVLYLVAPEACRLPALRFVRRVPLRSRPTAASEMQDADTPLTMQLISRS
ncbi:hypothetical protein B484DRAFT_392483 [Ochromonadaceae sp. CCMP2298]|nr:hypothetical protein B484DRAFT_392483 [Ochromonadaceae sp. CCMP2298]